MSDPGQLILAVNPGRDVAGDLQVIFEVTLPLASDVKFGRKVQAST
jgi:hypothetical protein